MTAERPDAGMVLVEVLAALAIVAVMSGLMAGFIGQLGLVSALERDTAAESELAAAADHVRQVLESARSIRLGLDPESDAVFDGGASAVRLVGISRRGFRSLALRRIELYAEPGPGGLDLVQAMAPKREGVPPEPTVVVDGLSAVGFAYGDAGGSFASTWEASELPSAVRILLERTADDGRTLSAATVARLR